MDMHSLLLAKMMLGGSGNVETEAPVVPLDMTGENQIIVPSDGKLISQATIIKPDDLKPENILEGKDIGGIIGTLVAGGGGANFKYYSVMKKASGTGQGARFSVSFGFVPDVIVVQSTDSISSSGEIAVMAWGISSRFADKVSNASGTMYCEGGITRGSNGTTYFGAYYTKIDETTPAAYIYGADATGFNMNRATSGNYYTIVAYGLT